MPDADDEPQVPEAFVFELARRIFTGELTKTAALIAVDLAVGREVVR